MVEWPQGQVYAEGSRPIKLARERTHTARSSAAGALGRATQPRTLMVSTQRSPAGSDFDRLIQRLYSLAVDDEWQAFRPHALEIFCGWLGATDGAWLTRSAGDPEGQFTEFPADSGLDRKTLANLPFEDGQRELQLALSGTHKRAGAARAFCYSHRGGGLISVVLLRFANGVPPLAPATLQRAVGHLIEAGSLSLRYYIMRDEWLSALGRPSRGTAGLVDQHGVIYSASPRFRLLISEHMNVPEDMAQLPFKLPEAVLEGGNSFFHGNLHFRVSQQPPLFLIHTRPPLPLDALSPREQEIARALGNGKTFKSVARQFDIAVSTVANHASRIYRKLGIYRREDLVGMVRAPGVPKDD